MMNNVLHIILVVVLDVYKRQTLSIAPDREEAFPALKAFDILVISAACAHANANIKANVSKSRFISFL